MTQISARGIYFAKRIVPVLAIAFAGLLLSAMVFGGQRGPKNPQWHILIPFVFVFFGVAYFNLRKLLFDLVDSVWDDGDALVIRNRRREERILLSDILSVSYAGFLSPSRVTLYLRRPSCFGDEIAFAIKPRAFGFRLPPVVRELMVRVDEAKRGHDFPAQIA